MIFLALLISWCYYWCMMLGMFEVIRVIMISLALLISWCYYWCMMLGVFDVTRVIMISLALLISWCYYWCMMLGVTCVWSNRSGNDLLGSGSWCYYWKCPGIKQNKTWTSAILWNISVKEKTMRQYDASNSEVRLLILIIITWLSGPLYV